jgi:hypothetical protein
MIILFIKRISCNLRYLVLAPAQLDLSDGISAADEVIITNLQKNSSVRAESI